MAGPAPVGRSASRAGTSGSRCCRPSASWLAWFVAERGARPRSRAGRVGNVVAWWGSPDREARGHRVAPGLGLDGGAFDGPLGVVSALAAVDLLRARGFAPTRPLGRLGVRRGGGITVRAGLPGLAAGDRPVSWGPARELRDRTGCSCRRLRAAGLSRLAGRSCWKMSATFVELHVEQGRDLVDRGRPVAVASDLAARALPLRVRRVSRPCGGHADGGQGTTRCSPTR